MYKIFLDQERVCVYFAIMHKNESGVNLMITKDN